MNKAAHPAIALDALVFDVQGTLLDFYTPVRSALVGALPAADHDALTLAWRRRYFTGMEDVTDGGRPFVPTAVIYREGLDAILPGVEEPSSDERDRLTSVWTRLVPWPDTVEGLGRLRSRYALVALTNGSMAATIAMAARHDLRFHAVLATELVATYKPAPATYKLALDSLGHPPERVMMVASHPYDLEAARKAGMRTAFVERPLEFGPGTRNEATAPAGTDLVVTDLLQLAAALGA